ncbi:DUF6544 family protein [Nannocystaceae bacterium ST9]
MPVLVLFSLSLTALMIGLGFGVLLNRSAFERRVDAEVATLFTELDTLPTYHAERELDGLPVPVQRFMRRNLEDGTPHLSCARLRQSGNLRERPGQPWTEFEAEEYVVASTPALLWYARLRPFPLVWVDNRELLVSGRAHSLSKIFSTLGAVDRDDDATRRTLLLRWMVDLVFVPSAMLPRDGLSWTALDDDRAELTVREGEHEVHGIFVFDDKGDVVRFESDERPWLGESRPQTALWIAEFGEHRAFGGLSIPTRFALRWELDGQTFPYQQAKLDLFETEVPRRFGAPAPRSQSQT